MRVVQDALKPPPLLALCGVFHHNFNNISPTKSSEHFKNHHPKLQKIIHKNFTTKRLSQNGPTMIKHQPQTKTQQTTTTINEKF